MLLLPVLSRRVSQAWNPHQVITEPRYLKLVKLLSIYFDLCVDATGVVCHQLGLLSTDLNAICCGGFAERLN